MNNTTEQPETSYTMNMNTTTALEAVFVWQQLAIDAYEASEQFS